MTITVIILEKDSPKPPVYPLPLIYELDFDHDFERGNGIFGIAEEYKEEILTRVAEERCGELGIDDIEAAKEGIQLCFALTDIADICMDWRM